MSDTAEHVDRDTGGKGIVVKKKVEYGDETCKCVRGNPAEIHGPYLYRYYREGGELTSECFCSHGNFMEYTAPTVGGYSIG